MDHLSSFYHHHIADIAKGEWPRKWTTPSLRKMEISGLNYLHKSVQLDVLDSRIIPDTRCMEDTTMSKIEFLPFIEFIFHIFPLLISSMWPQQTKAKLPNTGAKISTYSHASPCSFSFPRDNTATNLSRRFPYLCRNICKRMCFNIPLSWRGGYMAECRP